MPFKTIKKTLTNLNLFQATGIYQIADSER